MFGANFFLENPLNINLDFHQEMEGGRYKGGGRMNGLNKNNDIQKKHNNIELKNQGKRETVNCIKEMTTRQRVQQNKYR